MSEIRVTNVIGENGSSPVNFTEGINMSGICTAPAFIPSQGQLSHRNKLINGAMRISQRGTSETGVNSSGYKKAPDRWTHQMASVNSAFTVSQSTDSPDGFANSYKIDVTTADTSMTAAHIHFFRQKIEGQNLQDFAFGTSSAKQLTVSFYVKTNKTGTYICELFNIGGNKQVSKSYTVSNTNWNRYSLTFPADTATAITNDNANRFHVAFWLSAGSDYTTGTLNSSAFATNVQANRAVGQVNLHDSTSNEWLLTGVQLEIGTVATPFEHRSIGEELSLCQRYFFNITGNSGSRSGIPGYANSTSSLRCMVQFPTPMRLIPTVSGSSTAMVFDSQDDSASFNCSSLTAGGAPTTSNPKQMCIEVDTSGMTNGQGGQLEFRAANGFINFDAEL